MDNRMMLKKRIYALDFAIWEFGLYLDTHPQDKAAIIRRRALMKAREELVAEYERFFGKYVVRQDDVTGDDWCWINGPWPWENRKEM